MPKFTRKKENFICEHCAKKVSGDGYTNHCPHCLWSKHVDVNPGDRAELCGGLMKPADIYLEGREWIITHECEICGLKKRNKVQAADDMEKVIELQKAAVKKKMVRK